MTIRGYVNVFSEFEQNAQKMKAHLTFKEATLTEPKVKLKATHIPHTESTVGTSNKYFLILLCYIFAINE